jgi:hypothetical protein
VKFVFRAVIDGSPSDDDTYEETVVAFNAADDSEAVARTPKIVEDSTPTYKNVYGQAVTWQVEFTSHPFELDGKILTEGQELYSQFYRMRNGKQVAPPEVPD